MQYIDTIAQIITAPGRGAVGIVRISGPDAIAMAAALYDGRTSLNDVPSHSITYGWVHDENGRRIDEALFLVMKAPKTYTGEDIVEIQCHGGTVATSEVLRLVMAVGARPAEEGEFTRRAFLNGKIDFTRAEAIMDLVDAKSQQMLSVAAQQKNGYLQRKIEGVRAEILELIAFLQADIDYPDDDIERLTPDEFVSRAEDIIDTLSTLLATQQRGRMYREGIRVAIAGKPNVGKSSLLNALVGRNSAIVTSVAGTTRDVVRERMNINGIFIDILDTAGLRETTDEVEKIGIDKAKTTVQEADLLLYVLDPSQGICEIDNDVIKSQDKKKILLVVNKSDLQLPPLVLPDVAKNLPMMNISAKDEVGIADLCARIAEIAMDCAPANSDDFYVINSRHISLLQIGHKDMAQFIEDIRMGIPEDLLVINLQHAWENLGLITGATAADDLLNEIFSKFCLGK